MKRAIGTILLVAASQQIVVPQTVADLQSARDYPAAIAQLQKERDADPKKFGSADRDYLLARLAEKDGRLALAMSTYTNVTRRESLLQGYALARMSRIARSMGNILLERIYLQQLEVANAENPLSDAAIDRIVRNSIETGNYALALSFLKTDRTDTPSTKQSDSAQRAYSRERKVMLGQAYLGLGNVEKARQVFTDLLDTTPDPAQADDHAQAAAAELDRLDGGDAADRVPELSEAEHLRRAGIYQFNRDFPAARRHYNAVIARFAANAADAIFQIGRGYSQSGNHVEALKWYERVLERHGESPTAKDALLQAAAAYGRVGKPKEAITRYQSFIEKYPSDEKLDRAYLNIVDLQRDQGSDQDALKWCAKTEEVFRGKPAEAVAVFAAARIHIAREEWLLAHGQLERLANFKDLGGATIPGGTNTAEEAFLKAFVLEQLKRYAEAIDHYLAINDGRNEYYGWRATERLRAMALIEEAKPVLAGKAAALKNVATVKSADAKFASARSLHRIGENAEVRAPALQSMRASAKTLPKYADLPEIRPANQTSAIDPTAKRLIELGLYDDAIDEFSPTQAELFVKADRADLGLAVIEPAWKKVPADYPIELMPSTQLRLLYPAVFQDDLVRESFERGVDPRLMLAIMRQESRFQPDAKSFAAARGLMQFISTTSIRVAGELELKGFAQDDLYSPSNSILFGSHYVKTLFAAFPEQTDAVVASYNGGDDNMKRWLARSQSSLPDRYVPEIMFTQTKDYVYKVMANYRMYTYLYDKELRPVEEAGK
ncbi:MAG: transglycosylase SLT domain-containing protein [Pyrinomonadaceae bacterium]